MTFKLFLCVFSFPLPVLLLERLLIIISKNVGLTICPIFGHLSGGSLAREKRVDGATPARVRKDRGVTEDYSMQLTLSMY